MFVTVVRTLLTILLAVEPFAIPADPGVYALGPNGLTPVVAQPVVMTGQGGGVSRKATLGKMGGRKVMGEVLGERAQLRVSSTPVFYYRVPPHAENAASGADLVLVRLERKKNVRQFEVGADSNWKAGSGVSLRSQLQVYRMKVASGVFKLVPAEDLKPGEYGFFYFRGQNLPGLMYDFTVE